MRQLTDIEQEKEMDFYNNLNELFLSPSAIKLLLESPKQYQEAYIYGNKEQKKAKHFDEGSLLHCMVLEPELLDEQFINMGIATPSDSTKACIDYLLALERNASELEEYAGEIVDYLKEVNLHQSLVDDKKPGKDGFMFTGDEKRVGKIINENTKEYFKLMVEAREKTIVDTASWDKCLAKANAIKANAQAQFLLTKINEEDEIAFELELREPAEKLGTKYNLKGILDCIKLDRETKTLHVTDLKTTGGKLSDFQDAAEKYDYWTQAAVYGLLAKQLVTRKAYEYKVEVNFLVVDRMDDVYCFKVSDETLARWQQQLIELVDTKINYHIENKDFTLPYDFANNLVIL